MERVLIVDDEEAIRNLNRRILENSGYACELASDADEARACLSKQPFDLVLCDINMPGESGMDFIKSALVDHPDMAAVMLTGFDDPSIAEDAFNSGVYDYLPKPIGQKRLLISVNNALHRRSLEMANRSYREDLEKMVAERTKKIKSTLDGIIKAMAMTIEIRDPYTAGHQKRVADLACAVARKIELPPNDIEGLQMGGVIHDLGKIAVPAEILSKPGKLSEIEFSLIRTHPHVGYEILKDIEFPWPIAEMVRQHHERCDGSGYPDGLSGDQIAFEARILCVADVVEAMASHRPYRPGLGIDSALAEIQANAGRLYDPSVVDGCLRLFKEDDYSL